MKKHYFILTIFMLSILGVQAQTFNETMGTGSGVNITSGDFNTMYGDSTGSFITSGSRTTLLGYSAGRSVTTSELTAIGYLAGYSNTTGFDNTFIGYEAGRLTVNGGDNTFVGAESGENNTTGYDNTFVGEESGANNTTGYENTFIGEDAGFSNTTGYKNTFIGNEVGISSDVGYRNTGVGSESMSDVDDGHHNTGLGDSAAIDIGDGIYNTMVGAAAGVATEYADYNTFIGAQSGWDNNRTNNTSNANHNTYVGFSAGFTNREGQYNVGMGSLADFDNTNRSNTMFFGYNITASNNNVMGFGNNSFIDGPYSISLGIDHDVRGQNSIMMGYLGNMPALADYSVGIGDRVDIAENDVVGIGRSVNVDNQYAVAIGSTTVAQNDGAIVIGYTASSTDPGGLDPTNNIAIGNAANVQGRNAVAIGNAATAVNDNSMVLGGATNPLSVGIGTDAPNANASLDLVGFNKGLLVNRVTNAQRTNMETSPASGIALDLADEGLMVFDTEDDALYVWDGSDWVAFGSGTDDQTVDLFQLDGNNLELSLEDDGAAALQVDLSGYLDNTDNQTADVFQLNGNNLELSLEDDGAATQQVDLSGYLDNTDDQTADVFQLNGNNLELSLENDGAATQQVDLSGYLDNTDNQNIAGSGLAGTDLTIGISGGTSQTVDLSSLNDSGTDDQQLSIAGNSLDLEDGGSVDLSGYLDNTDNQNIAGSGLAGTDLTIGISGGASQTVDLSSLDDSGTDDQQLSIAGNSLDLEDGGSVDLSGYLDNTDNQNIAGSGLAGTDLTIGISGGASQTVDLSSLDDSGTDDQQLSIAGNSLNLEDGGSVDLSGYLDNTDNQNIAGSGLAGTNLTIGISGGASQTVDLSSLDDSGTDDQQLSIAGNSLNLEDGGSVDLSGYLDNTDNQNIAGSGLTGTDLTIGISGGASQTIDLSSLNNAGTDDQTLGNFLLTNEILSLAIEDGNVVNVSLAPLIQPLEDENAAQQAQIDALLANAAAQQALIDDLIDRVEALEDCACKTLDAPDFDPNTGGRAYLYQNVPNPFGNTTSIGYYIPFEHSRANLLITTTEGKVLSNIAIREFGEGTIEFNKSTLQSAMYFYTLYVDGERVDTKRMLVE
ncbi:hypothetical protein G5B37_01625 [Rasiella rasia]|uniref:Uncharacterized protein n=1 Tax=Rasiella rasia TaxID=2744027 RepID=A0A6G6GIE2_9FLAO|nr:hypothetical protein [Rasiella rasia]QIE58312.1 hypothetical protein G5B37_01625 [Rasiella rasia]